MPRFTLKNGLQVISAVISSLGSWNVPSLRTQHVDLKVYTLRGIHTHRKDRSTQIIKCSPWGTEVQPYPSLKKKMVEFMRFRWTTATHFANRSFQPRLKVAAKKHNLVPLTRPNREKLSQPRKINLGQLPEATQQNWAATLGKAKDAAGKKTACPPYKIASQCTHYPQYLPLHLKLLQNLWNIPHIAWYVPHSEKHAQKNSLCHWIRMMMKKKRTRLKVKTKIKIMRWRLTQTDPRFFAESTSTLQPPKPSIPKHCGKRSSVTPEMKECNCDTIAMLLGHEDQNQDTLEDIG